MRTAFSSMALNTGSSWPGELLMTRSTSEVAVCCSRDSERSCVRVCTSSKSRTFSIAITAWSAKVVTSSICFRVKGCGSLRCSVMTSTTMPSRIVGTASPARTLTRSRKRD